MQLQVFYETDPLHSSFSCQPQVPHNLATLFLMGVYFSKTHYKCHL